MSSLKKPEMIIGIINSVGIIGTSIYFYNQINKISSESLKMATVLLQLANEFTATKTQVAELMKMNNTINEFVNMMKKYEESAKIAQKEQDERFEEIEDNIGKIADILKIAGYEIDLNSHSHAESSNKKYTKKSRDAGKNSKKHSTRSESRYRDSDSSSDEDSHANSLKTKKKK